ncbi:tannase and feruloyl esterase [Fusarium flagelliforme]|uniref:Carboxylic ester hydrolase n=1 Tax=Fusarium flagelliforme TaxID=2675880 RepID=A0A395MYZ6_9HYPO|nr:tannase and feruloyl esterase [Fusarium flagelliforme]
MSWVSTAISVLVLISPSGASPHCDLVQDCQLLGERANIPNATIHVSEVVKAGTNLTFPFYDKTCTSTSEVVKADICRLSFDVDTSTNSSVRFEAWLPLDWSGRFLGVGNGGLGGCFKYDELDYGSSYGFATIGTNNGHDGNHGRPFYNSLGTVEDYSYRAIHLEAVLGKQIVKAFYGSSQKRSYYLGCSTGGRQGFKEAQEFPDDFDGIVAGAPAFDMLALFYWSGVLGQALGMPGSPTYLNSADWSLIYDNILEQCDELDGVKDGVLDDPDLCQYRPEALICALNQTSGCLTGPKAETVRTILSPVYGPDGQFVYSRLQPGSNATDRFTSIEQPFGYLLDWMRYVVKSDPSWDPWTFTANDWLELSGKDEYGVSTWNGNLTGSRDSGTKILHYHGLQDPLITSDNSARYYNHVSRTMGLSSKEMDNFYRYFRISGLAHCRGGTGANMIGGNAGTLGPYEPESNVLAAIVEWVENGNAPEFIQGTQYASSDKKKADALKRHCRYPRRNVYVKGDPKSPDSWICK